MILAACIGVIVAMALMLVRLFAGPSLFDRVLAVNSFGTKTVLFLALFAFLIDRPDAIDIALLYALINFVSTIAVLKFVAYGRFDGGLERLAGAPGGLGDGGEVEAPRRPTAIPAPNAPSVTPGDSDKRRR